jgi:hypothetical protein
MKIDTAFFESKGVRVIAHQPWQFGLFHNELAGKLVWYPGRGALIHEAPTGIKKLGHFYDEWAVCEEMETHFHTRRNDGYREIFCTGCNDDVEARLTNGKEMYPHRADLARRPFWVHDACGAFVGTHYKTRDHLKPLGSLATKEVKQWRMRIHQLLDPLWQSGKIKRGDAYARISKALGHTYHTGEIYNAEEGEFVYAIVKAMRDELEPTAGPFNR